MTEPRILEPSARDKMITEARAAAPTECCGVLLGLDGRIVDAVPGRNVAETPRTRYQLDPQDHFNAIRAARRAGLQVVGFYHSHPHSAAAPSETDLAEANYPGYLYVIVGLAGSEPEMRGFRLDGETLVPLELDGAYS